MIVGQTDALAAELFPQDTVLLDQVVDGDGDGVCLMAVDPAGEGGEEESEGERVGHRAPIIDPLSKRRKSSA